MIRKVDSEWFGLMLDTGSVAGPDPYMDIEKLIPFAVSWQVKEQVRTTNGNESLDVDHLLDILHKHQYHGFLPLETLGEGDPHIKVKDLFQRVAHKL